jgi:uncharacterized protein (DUF488 family)
MGTIIHTVGHSTQTSQELADLVGSFGVTDLIDIRAIPYSGYNPQFNREEMERTMPDHGLRYEHIAELGGHRPSQEVMKAAKSCSERSRGFAEYMLSAEFARGIDRVLTLATETSIALMCAERDPTHCHRYWVADELTARGIEVRHIISPGKSLGHEVSLFTFV